MLLFETGELEKRAQTAVKTLQFCHLCPQQCGVNRIAGERGQCHIGVHARIYSYMPHHGEEAPLSATKGSGTIFFSGCNLHCEFCQNSEISQDLYGLDVDAGRIAEMMLSLQKQGCHNINLVSPTHVVPQILEALVIAVSLGLHLPIVYNSGGYDKVETLRLLDGIINIYMPDMKYADQETAWKYSGIRDYPIINQAAVCEMHRQVGDLILNSQGIAERGLLIRHLVLPNDLAGTEKIVKFIAENISKNTYLNLMDQYRPDYHACQYPELSRRTTPDEFARAIQIAIQAGLKRFD